MKAKDLTLGTMLDLEHDIYAQDANDNYWEFEYGIVYSLEQETDDCILVTFNDDVSIGFPVDHEVTTIERD